LRTPMNAILGSTQRVLRKAGDALPERQRRNLETVHRNARQLLELINGLLDLSRIEAGRMEVHAERFEAGDVISDVADLIAPLAAEKDLAFDVERPDSPIELETDRTKLKQILTNLLGNAMKFTETGRVVLRCRREGAESVLFEVEDTGPGIPEEALPYIFEPFRQVEGGDTRRKQGSGLGLAIVRRFARLLGGAVEVESRVGSGTLFRVRVAVTAPACRSGAGAGAAARVEV